ncbi:hypothetical protein E2C01_087298 [Portunus trituberculatus]|uniref:Uncharacterized protein n=1 Tax=Portunus trituberculatus TaxID=210409 RepID=A0A5B7J2Y4_PORTR|nr:hypothetical protein [Portunus trituberculatus]
MKQRGAQRLGTRNVVVLEGRTGLLLNQRLSPRTDSSTRSASTRAHLTDGVVGSRSDPAEDNGECPSDR